MGEHWVAETKQNIKSIDSFNQNASGNYCLKLVNTREHKYKSTASTTMYKPTSSDYVTKATVWF